jgi:ribonuclease HII
MKEKETKEPKFLLGIDDAGRGPVIGPMALAGVLIKKSSEEGILSDGVKDSKLLTAKQRTHLAELIKEKAIEYCVQLITPSEIDTGFGDGLNLNQVEALVAGKIINDLTQENKLSKEDKKSLKIIIDCPSNNIPKWKEYVVRYLKDKSLSKLISCEHKADFNHPVVSAASIIAKTTRDAEIEKLKKQIGIDFGSGYPSDPNTKKFLEVHADKFKNERIFRESWATWQEATGKTNKKSGKKDKKSKQVGLDDF